MPSTTTAPTPTPQTVPVSSHSVERRACRLPGRPEKADLAEAQVLERECRAVVEAGVGDSLRRSSLDDDRDTDDRGAGLLEGVDRSEHRTTGSGGVLHGEHATAGHIGPLDPPLQAVRFAFLAHDE